MRRPWLGLLAAVLSACSLVNDPGSHQGGAADAGPPDAGPRDAGPPDAGPPRVEATEFCDQLARLECDAFFSCCDAHPPRTDDTYSECVETAQSTCAREVGGIILDSRTGYDPFVAAQALQEGRDYFANAACDPNIVRWEWERSGFQRVLTGTVEGGDVCTPRDTTLSEFDRPALFSCVGADRACVPTGGTWNCLARAEVGGHCVLYWDCVDGLRCDWTNIISPMCAARRPTGQGCDYGSDCESLACVDHVCVERTQQNVYCHPGV